MKIERIVFLIHPGCYQALPADSPLQRSNLGLFVEREKQAQQRWIAEWAGGDRRTLLLQLYGPRPLFEAARKLLGDANACYVEADWNSITSDWASVTGDELPNKMRAYYRLLTDCIRGHMDRHGLAFDPETVASEIWGESFEGCATNYSSAFAHELGLRRPPVMRYEMVVADTRFLEGARGPEVVRLPGTDVEAMLFELFDGSSAAIFQCRLHPQYLDRRPIRLMLDPARTQVCTYSGFTLWPKEPPVRSLPQEPEPYALRMAFPSPWVRGVAMSLDELRRTVASAVVGDPDAPAEPAEGVSRAEALSATGGTR
jgi:hypothetical protein